MKLYRVFILSLFIASFGIQNRAFAAKLQMLKFSDTIPVKNMSRSKLLKYAEEWFEQGKPNLKLVRKNSEQFMLEGKGFLLYYNHVELEDVLLSPRASERTNGTIVFSIKVSVQDSIVVVDFSDFTHDAYFSEYGKLSFGTLFEYQAAPPGKCMEAKQWCNMVWSEMKERSKEESLAHFSKLIPESARRKKGKLFKQEKEEEKQVVEKEDPDAYLRIENYLIKEEDTASIIIKEEDIPKKKKK